MKSIQIHKYNKNVLKDYSDGSFDELVNKLIDDVKYDMPLTDVDDSTPSSIMLNDDTLDKLDSFKLTVGESYENILIRMMICAKDLNTGDG